MRVRAAPKWLAAGISGREAHHRADGGNEIDALQRAIEDHTFANTGADSHQPGGARESITGAMVLEAVAAGVFVGVAAKIGEDEEGGFAGVFGLGLYELPEFVAETIGAANALDIEGIGASVGDVDVMQGDPEQAGSELLHEAANDVDGELVGTGEREGVGLEIVDGELEKIFHLLELEGIAGELRSIERSFIAVAQKVAVIGGPGSGSGEQMFGKNDAGAGARAEGAIAAFADAIEAVAGGDDPGVRGGALEFLAEIFEDGGRFGGDGGEIVEGFVGAGGEAGGGDVMAENAAIDNLSKEGGLRNELLHQVGDVFLAFGSKSFLIASAAAEGDDDDFAFGLRGGGEGQRGRA